MSLSFAGIPFTFETDLTDETELLRREDGLKLFSRPRIPPDVFLLCIVPGGFFFRREELSPNACRRRDSAYREAPN